MENEKINCIGPMATHTHTHRRAVYFLSKDPLCNRCYDAKRQNGIILRSSVVNSWLAGAAIHLRFYDIARMIACSFTCMRAHSDDRCESGVSYFIHCIVDVIASLLWVRLVAWKNRRGSIHSINYFADNPLSIYINMLYTSHM